MIPKTDNPPTYERPSGVNAKEMLHALESLRGHTEAIRERIALTKLVQGTVEQLVSVLGYSIDREEHGSPARQILAESCRHLVKGVAGLEGYITILKLLAPAPLDSRAAAATGSSAVQPAL